MSEYVLMSPARNERGGLPGLLADLEAQHQRPGLWLVVDDGSDDGSRQWLVAQAASRPPHQYQPQHAQAPVERNSQPPRKLP